MCIIQQLLRILTCWALSLTLCYPLLVAQTPRTESLTIADGLSQGMIFDIVQTQDGFLWFATKDGLNRYDGYHFEVFTNDPFNPFSIAGNEVTHLLEDSRGNLWMSLMGQGLDMLEKNTGKFFHLSSFVGIPGSLSIYQIIEASDGSIWVATANGLLRIKLKPTDLIDTENPDLSAAATVELVKNAKAQAREEFSNLIANPDGTLFLSNYQNQTYRYHPGQQQLTEIFRTKSTLFADSPQKGRFTILNAKMFLIDGDSMQEIRGGKYPYRLIFQHDSEDLMWACFDGKASYLYSIPKEEIYRTGSVANAKLIFYQNKYAPSAGVDRSGNLWVGSSGYGLQKIKLAQLKFQHFLKGNSIRSVFNANGIYLKLGGDVDVFSKLDETTGRALPAIGFFSNVSQLFLAKNKFTYVFGDDGIRNYLAVIKNGLTEKQHIQFNAGGEISAVAEDESGNIWMGGWNAQIMGVQASTNKVAYLELADQLGTSAIISSLYLDADKNLWVGSTNGMARIDSKKMGTGNFWNQTTPQKPDFQITVFQTDPTDPSSLRYNYVTSFCEDPAQPERYLWVSTKGGGLSRLDKQTGKFRHFTSQNSGLPNDVVYGILPDDQGNLWMSTNRGLSRMTVDGFVFKNFRESDGLQSDEFNTGVFTKSPDGRLLFGGVNGLTAFYPSEIKNRKSNAQVNLTGLKINNLSVDYFQKDSPLKGPIHRTEQLTLDHTQNLVTLEFALMDFSTPQENRYRYRLQGVDPNWVEAGTSHTANYAQLQPGKYLFEVMGSIGGSEWTAPATLHLTILPPWWATWWAYSIYFLMLLGTAIAILHFFRKRLLLQNALKLEHEEAIRLKELDSFKSRLFTNLTHEFRTPLTVILGMAQQLVAGDKDKAKISNGLKLIENNGKSLLRLINQLLDLSKLENNAFQLNQQLADIVPYLRYVTESFQTYANSKNLSLRFFTTLEKLDMDFDPEQIKQVMTNLISNGVKFTPASGEIKVKLTASEDLLAVEVSDTGIGIAEKDLPHVFDRFFQADNSNTRPGDGTGIGLAHTQELVKVMGGSISVESKLGKGTSFKVTLPITQLAPKNDRAGTIEPFLTEQVIGSVMNEEKKASLSDAPTVLIVEDNPDVVLYLRSCLEDIYQLEVAYNGKIGIEKALELIPDLIISDVMMPEKDGYQVCDTLKNDLRTSHIPIILLTAKADAASMMAGLRRGADAYLSKPFELEELLVRVSVLLDNQRRIAAYFAQNLQNGETAPLADAALSEAVQVEDAFVKKVNEIIEENYADEDFALPQLCQKIGMSRSQLFRKMKAVMDTAPSDLIRTFRLNKAKMLLENEGLNVAEAAYQVGFKDPSYFSKLFQEEFGVQPSATHK